MATIKGTNGNDSLDGTNSAAGVISYDADDAASTLAVHFAAVNAGLALTNADFIIV